MTTQTGKRTRGVLAAIVISCALSWGVSTQDRTGPVALDADDIGGVVKSAKGPEAGVWVIAETSDLPTKFARIVVTDDQGRYVLPDLPKATYDVWARGYGLVDSKHVKAVPGKMLDLAAVVAPSPQAAANFYPPDYWLALLKVPPGKLSEREVINGVKGCMVCHALGTKATREIPESLGRFQSSVEAWTRRVRSGPNGAAMAAALGRLGPQGAAMFADWSDRIAGGEYPKSAPARPKGVERNLVISMWDWGHANGFVHDESASDKRDARVNANGPVFGPSASHDMIYWVDPVKNAAGSIKVVPRDADFQPSGAITAASPYWGEEVLKTATQPRSAQMDKTGRVWISAKIRQNEKQPEFCKPGSANAFAKYFPLARGSKQAGYYDQKTKQVTLIDTCFTTDHNDFAPDDTLYFGSANNGATDVVGWIDTRAFDKTHNDETSQGWCPAVLDTNGDGKITEWTEPDQPVDPKKDHRIKFDCYSPGANPVDGAIWCTGSGRQVVRLERGSSPPQTCKAEVYEAPAGKMIDGSRGVEVDGKGLVWVNFNLTDHVGSFDRSKCKVLNGPTATGQQCPEGWTFHETKTGATFPGTPFQTDRTYLMNVDRHNTLGLGKDVPVTHAINSDAVLAFTPELGQVTLRVPYPIGSMFARSSHGRIDDPNAGWKGRGLWMNVATYAIWHQETGKGTLGKAVKFQFRPSPLAK
jgi:hypothetical protein